MNSSFRNTAAGCFLVLFLFSLSWECFGAKKSFKGLFGSYRREQFIENEANNTEIGINLMLSTLLPLSDIIKSSEDGTTTNSLHYATFFNQEISFFFTLGYHWEFFLNVGYYEYETRKENVIRTQATLPLFHQFEMQSIPVVGGIKYRLSTSDIVPYLGLGAGMAFSRKKAFYDYNDVTYERKHFNYVVGQLTTGLEFYISPNAGIQMEISAHYMALPGGIYDTGGTPANFPIFHYQANVWTVRYASGIFFLF